MILLLDAALLGGITEREYNGTLTLWNRRWYVWGVMPKLNFEAQKTTSNISLYAYQKQRVYLSLDRRF